MLEVMGPFTGLPTLRAVFPQAPRNDLRELVGRYRREHVLKNAYWLGVLRWPRAGACWSMDFAEPPLPVDGLYPYVLSVRDLASGNCLLWLPCRSKSAETVRDALQALFLRYGSPLVQKSDNDGAFTAPTVKALLARWSVTALLSPPYFPRYNGACESGIGTLKAFTHHASALRGRPGEWSCDDLESARSRANQFGRPRGSCGPNPETLWRTREAILADERDVFQERVQLNREIAQEELVREKGAFLGPRDLALAERQAIQRALLETGNLDIRRRRIRSPNKWRKLS